MGSCSSIIKPTEGQIPNVLLCTYPTKVTIKTKTQPENQIEMILTKPLHISINLIPLNTSKLWVTSSVLPGQDPTGTFFQKCIDSCIYLNENNTILLALFDGHGSQGEQIINFCCSYTSKYYRSQKESIESDPKTFLINLSESCDLALRNPETRINTEFSGTTAVFVLIKNDIIYSACVGHSRAVLGSYINREPLLKITHLEENKALAEVRKRRGSKLQKKVFYTQLTRDHKPEINEEAQRIRENGGKVKRLLDYEGNRIGPYRVWENDTNLPGLIMSRSIGDNVAKNIGVISTPDITSINIDWKNDLFLIVGSDGLWDAMANDDVVNFVEFYRDKSYRGNNRNKDTPSLQNSNIAQLLCEEARTRWFAIVEEDNVSIDDISCIILELNKASGQVNLEQKKNKIIQEVKDIENEENHKGIRQNNLKVKDPRRGSQMELMFNF
ncbi:hypothetical protein SteCoe_27197 [Stentor coeruleus]|uniref:PPM-type phosphatase domain-containing protein n=1 Tax=Stentor coeruleus TaxID=5963 RepID=A0A1R2BB60_9CILI|nr:hypothetical protein SteCoe_27197 [Stentor coeruleus]